MILKSLKYILRYVVYIRKYIHNYYAYLYSRKKDLSKTDIGEKVLFDIRYTGFRDRNLSNFIVWLHLYGYEVHLKGSLIMISRLGWSGKKLLGLNRIKIVHKTNQKYFAVFSDIKQNKEDHIELKENAYEIDRNDEVQIPLGLHPNMYFNGHFNKISSVSNQKRRVRIFFSGRIDEDKYNSDILKNQYSLLSRFEIFRILKNSTITPEVVFPENEKELYYTKYRNKIIFHDKSKFRIPQGKFLDYISQCDFFLFTPGVTYPICHNNFEAMSVGAIPLLQYPNYFYPKLEHGKNCIVFNDQNDLIDKIEYVLTMDDEEVFTLRKNILEYYRTTQSPRSVVKNISERIQENSLKSIYFRINFDHGFLHR